LRKAIRSAKKRGGDVVTNHERGERELRFERLDHLVDRRPVTGSRPVVGLVIKQDLRLADDRASESHALSHAPEKLVPATYRARGHPELGERRVHSVRDLALFEASYALSGESDVVEDRHVVKERRFWKASEIEPLSSQLGPRHFVISFPRTQTSPESASERPRMCLSSTDFPAPEEPRM